MAIIIDGKALAAKVKAEVAVEAEQLSRRPGLADRNREIPAHPPTASAAPHSGCHLSPSTSSARQTAIHRPVTFLIRDLPPAGALRPSDARAGAVLRGPCHLTPLSYHAPVRPSSNPCKVCVKFARPMAGQSGQDIFWFSSCTGLPRSGTIFPSTRTEIWI